MNIVRTIVRPIGSLWFAAVLLLVLLVAMACATVFESGHGTERALREFYQSWWFESLLGLLAGNLLAAMIVRYPFSRKQIGFVLAHAAILFVLGGALITRHWGLDGRVAIAEGETIGRFNVSDSTLTLLKESDLTRETVALDPFVFNGFDTVEGPNAPAFSKGGIRVEVKRYVPDSTARSIVVNEGKGRRLAVELSLSNDPKHQHRVWVFAGETAKLHNMEVAFREVGQAELARLLSDAPTSQTGSKGKVRIERGGVTQTVALEKCMNKLVPIGETGRKFRVLRYLPHAVVASSGKGLTNVSDRPVNPAIQFELIEPDGTSSKAYAFARFPDYKSMHGGQHGGEQLKLTFVTEAGKDLPQAAIEVLAGPGKQLWVRFATGKGSVKKKLTVGEPVASPRKEYTFTAHRMFDRASREMSVQSVEPVRQERTAAVLVNVTTEGNSSDMWVQRDLSRSVTIDGEAYELHFGDRQVPLGFEVKLDDFEVGYYPGGRRPRSFESRVTVIDPETGRRQARVISMNHPTTYGGYTFYQSSYREGRGPAVSILSVSRDPGQIVVFIGYIAMMAGMVVTLVTRLVDERRAARVQASQSSGKAPKPTTKE